MAVGQNVQLKLRNLCLQAFDGYVKGLLRRRYPPELMTELQTAFGSALADLADAFPDKTYAQTSNMQTFLKVRKSPLGPL